MARHSGALVSGLFHDLAHVDGKLLRTLPLLAFRPGALTRQYIDGRRTRYVGPNVIFLSSAFFMFLSFNVLPGPSSKPACNPADASAVRSVNLALRGDVQVLAPAIGDMMPGHDPAQPPPATAWLEKHAPPAMLAKIETALANPSLALSKVEQKAYKLGFLLVPLALPALWLLVGRRAGVRLYDLAVFSLYSIGFMSMLLTAVMALAGMKVVLWPLCVAILVVVPPMHFFVHLRDTFQLSLGETIWRTIILCMVATATLLSFLLMVLVLAILA